jgi:hypothetical protein
VRKEWLLVCRLEGFNALVVETDLVRILWVSLAIAAVTWLNARSMSDMAVCRQVLP